MVILTPITINNHVTKVDHLCSERHTFNFLLKKVDFRGSRGSCIALPFVQEVVCEIAKKERKQCAVP